MYRRSENARAVVHLHSPHSTAASCLPAWSAVSALPPITPYLVMRVGQAPLVPYAAPGSHQLAENLAATEIVLTADELAKLGELSALPAEYPGWMFAVQGRYYADKVSPPRQPG